MDRLGREQLYSQVDMALTMADGNKYKNLSLILKAYGESVATLNFFILDAMHAKRHSERIVNCPCPVISHQQDQLHTRALA